MQSHKSALVKYFFSGFTLIFWKNVVQIIVLLSKYATADELCEHLWEHKAGLIYKNRQYLYSLVSDLSTALKEHDALEALIKTANGYALDMAQIEISK